MAAYCRTAACCLCCTMMCAVCDRADASAIHAGCRAVTLASSDSNVTTHTWRGECPKAELVGLKHLANCG